MISVHRLLGMFVALTACGTRVPPDTVSAAEFRLSDGKRTRAVLGLEQGAPSLILLDERGVVRLRSSLDPNGRPSVAMFGDQARADAVLELDDKGAHILFRGSGKQESYLFQKLDGTAGMVLVDANGQHRGELKLSPTGDVDITLLDGNGKAVFATTVTRTGSLRPTEPPAH
jgi:hypothetical protein